MVRKLTFILFLAVVLNGCAYINPSIIKETAPDPTWQSTDISDAREYSKKTKQAFEKESKRFRDYNAVSAGLLKGAAFGGSGVAIFEGPITAIKGIAYGVAGVLSGEDVVRSKQRFGAFTKGISAIGCGETLANNLESSIADVNSSLGGVNIRTFMSQMNLNATATMSQAVRSKRSSLSSGAGSKDVNTLVEETLAVEKAMAKEAEVAVALDRTSAAFIEASDASDSLAAITLWGIVNDVRVTIEKQIVADVIDLSKVTNDMAERLKKIQDEVIAKYKAAAEEGKNTDIAAANLVATVAAKQAKTLEESVQNCTKMVSGS